MDPEVALIVDTFVGPEVEDEIDSELDFEVDLLKGPDGFEADIFVDPEDDPKVDPG